MQTRVSINSKEVRHKPCFTYETKPKRAEEIDKEKAACQESQSRLACAFHTSCDELGVKRRSNEIQVQKKGWKQ